jgi:DNA replication protein DnaC
MTMDLSTAGKTVSPEEQAAAICSTSPASEPVCSLCGGTGWRRADGIGNEAMRYRRCECVKVRMVAERLAVIPVRFQGAVFESYSARNPQQERALALMRELPERSWYMTGNYGSGKTHLFYAQYREMMMAGRILCHVRTTRELVQELKQAEMDDDFVSQVMKAASASAPYHLFWDDIDKLKPTDFKTEVLFELVDALYRQKHGLTVTANYSFHELVERERMHPAIVRRLDDMCRVIQL